MDASACSGRLFPVSPPRSSGSATARGGSLRQSRRLVRVLPSARRLPVRARGAPPAADANELAPPRCVAVPCTRRVCGPTVRLVGGFGRRWGTTSQWPQPLTTHNTATRPPLQVQPSRLAGSRLGTQGGGGGAGSAAEGVCLRTARGLFFRALRVQVVVGATSRGLSLLTALLLPPLVSQNGGGGAEAQGGGEARGDKKAVAVPAGRASEKVAAGGHQNGGAASQHQQSQKQQQQQQQQHTRGVGSNGAQQSREVTPGGDWDAEAAARARARLPLFKAQEWWESLFVREDGSPLLEWRRPAWMPEFIDPLDRKSDMRRWIAPYLIAPWLLAQLLKFSLVGPLLESELHRPGSTVFHLRVEQLEHVEQEAERYRSHLVFEQLLQRQPAMSDGELLGKVKDKLAVDEKELLERNCSSTTELVTDTTFATIVGLNILVNLSTVRRIQTAVGKEFFSMDSSRQAFLLLLVSDILVGYHSSEGWATALEVVADHYGIAERKDLTALFIAVVPVSVDVVFKYWCYSSLRNWSPDTQVILDEIDH
jgi:hypothetical protein